jgi:hypothetical protein
MRNGQPVHVCLPTGPSIVAYLCSGLLRMVWLVLDYPWNYWQLLLALILRTAAAAVAAVVQ